jgi:hypothetical protein
VLPPGEIRRRSQNQKVECEHKPHVFRTDGSAMAGGRSQVFGSAGPWWLGFPGDPGAETTHLRLIANLTPGDFGVVARQHRFRPLITSAGWVSVLEAECHLKRGQARARIGFLGAAS